MEHRPISSPDSETHIVFHQDDIDGLASSAIMSRIYGNAHIYPTDYSERNLLRVFQSIKIRCLESRDINLVITDLAGSPELIDHIIDLSEHDRCRFKLVWIDHHIWEIKNLNTLSESAKNIEKEVVIDTSKTATEIAYGLVDDKYRDIYSVLARLSRDSDFLELQHPLTEPLTDVIRYTKYSYGKIDITTSYIVGLFREGVLWNHRLEVVWQNLKDKKAKYLEDFNKTIRVFRIDNMKIGLGILEPIVNYYRPLKQIINNNDADLGIVIYRTGSIAMARNPDRRDIQCNELAKKLFNGGGHAHLAGGRIPKEIVYSGIEKIVEYIKHSLYKDLST